MHSIRSAYASVLKRRRKEMMLTQEELACRAGLTRNYISLLEKSQRSPTLETIFSISKALEMKLSKMVSLIEEEFYGQREGGEEL